MTPDIEEYIEKYPEEIIRLFMKTRDIVLSIDGISIEEKMWAKLPSYYYGGKVVRIIPFKDHINIEADGLAKHASKFEDSSLHQRECLQIQYNQEVDFDALKTVFLDTYM